jgi:chromosome segregation ATPase
MATTNPLLINDPKVLDRLKEIQSENEGLQNTLTQRDDYIASLGADKTALSNTVATLQSTLRSKESDLAALQAQFKASQDTLAGRNDVIAQNNAAIKTLQDTVSRLQSGGTTDAQLKEELQTATLKYSSAIAELHQRDGALAQLRNDFSALQTQYNQTKTAYDGVNAALDTMQKDKNAMQQELSILKQRVQASFSPDTLADYLTKTIDAFNSQANVSNSSVNYIVNEMNVELKAAVGKDDKNQMILAAPNMAATQDQQMSTVSIAIRSVPKS